MPHIHTEPGQHDITTSAWIFKEDSDGVRVLVHMHRRLGKLMQTGGHVELDETPWQTISHELQEEAGYSLSELRVLQPTNEVPVISGAVVHPTPVLSNTHMVDSGHYHSDYCYAFVADGLPKQQPAEGESKDLRWLTIDQLYQAAKQGDALLDVAEIYDYIAKTFLSRFNRVDATLFAVEKPLASLLGDK